jgi:hypothetical protein
MELKTIQTKQKTQLKKGIDLKYPAAYINIITKGTVNKCGTDKGKAKKAI